MTGGGRGAAIATVGALGVVFGDIGTSPLYALRTVLAEGGRLDEVTVYGLTSTIIWSLLLIVTMLYVGLLMSADNQGEGGLLALFGLLRKTGARGRVLRIAFVVAMLGASMFLGDAVITPAISVLSASEGLRLADPALASWVLPVALSILAGVFVLQRVGTGGIGRFYGPVMVLWFAVLAVSGVVSIAHLPTVLVALSPHWAVEYFLHDPWRAFLTLGAVILTVTGAEALFADLGHFDRATITRAWLLIVLPALVAGYLGEAAAVLRDHAAAADPFYGVIASWAKIPVLVLATVATVIASEAVIAGAFTVLHQAGGLRLLPYLRTRLPSPEKGGRIYLPAANAALGVSVLTVVLLFRSSERLASAYGIAVSTTMLATVTLFLLLLRERRGIRRWRGFVAAGGLLVVATFFAATVPKLLQGGWAPVGIGGVLLLAMWAWRDGSRWLEASRAEVEGPPREVLAEVPTDIYRPPYTAVFLTEKKEVAPFAVRGLADGAHVLARRVVLLSWHVQDTPAAPAEGARVTVEVFDERFDGIVGVNVVLGFRERLSVQHVLHEAQESHPRELAGVEPEEVVYVLSDALPALPHGGHFGVRRRLFVTMHRVSTDRIEQLSLPRQRTIVLGREFDL